MNREDLRRIPGYDDHEPVGLAYEPVGEPVVLADPDGRRIRVNYVAEDPYPPEAFPHVDGGGFAGDAPLIPGVSDRIGFRELESCRAAWEDGCVYGIVSQTFRVDPSSLVLHALSCETWWGCLDPAVAAASIGAEPTPSPPGP